MSRLALIPFIICALASRPSHASESEVELQSAGIRARVGETRVLGKEQPESFHEYDITAAIRLPWEARFHS